MSETTSNSRSADLLVADPSKTDPLIGTTPIDVTHQPAKQKATTSTQPATATQKKGGSSEPKQSKVLTQMALERYTLGQDEEGQPFAVGNEGPGHVQPMFRASQSIRAELYASYFDANGETPPSANAISEVMGVLHGKALRKQPVPVHLRVAKNDTATVDADGSKTVSHEVIIDLGDSDGRCVVINAGGWRVTTLRDVPVLFERTPQTRPLPVPQPGATLAELKRFVSIADEDWDLFCGYLVSTLIPGSPRPIGYLYGESGTAKSCTARKMVSLVDPSSAPLRKQPKDDDDWLPAARSAWLIALDNVSNIPDWLSDTLCRAVTGDANVKRSLFTNWDPTSMGVRRPLLITSIDQSASRGDLVERLVTFELERITDEDRLTEEELDEAFAERWPFLLGALYDLLALVLAKLPATQLERSPRMADFAKILGAMDTAVGTSSLRRCMALRETAEADVVLGNSVGLALLKLMVGQQSWKGTATQLYSLLQRPSDDRRWPGGPGALTDRLRRIMKELEGMGVRISEKRQSKARLLIIERTDAFDPDLVTVQAGDSDPF